MESTPQTSRPEATPQDLKKEKNIFGWTLFFVTIAIAIYQIYLHGSEIVTRYVPSLLNGDYFSFFAATDPAPVHSALNKAILALWTLNDFFITILLLVALVFMAFRKKATPMLLMVFVSFAGLFTLIVGIVMQNLLPVEVSGMTLGYNLTSAGFLAADILLFFLYLKSKKFRALFTRK